MQLCRTSKHVIRVTIFGPEAGLEIHKYAIYRYVFTGNSKIY